MGQFPTGWLPVGTKLVKNMYIMIIRTALYKVIKANTSI